jgi:hypothetical protein
VFTLSQDNLLAALLKKEAIFNAVYSDWFWSSHRSRLPPARLITCRYPGEIGVVEFVVGIQCDVPRNGSKTFKFNFIIDCFVRRDMEDKPDALIGRFINASNGSLSRHVSFGRSITGR